MFRANDEQVSINDKLTRQKFQTRVFHCLLNEISFVIALRFSLQPRLSSPRNINPDFPFILRIRHRFDIFFFSIQIPTSRSTTVLEFFYTVKYAREKRFYKPRVKRYF